MVVHTCHPKQGSINGRITVQAGPSIKRDSISKITNIKMAARVAHVAKYYLASTRP
jgi:hypothetical protein